MCRFYGHYDFSYNGTIHSNTRMKWISICFNIDYDDGTMQLYLNGKPLEGEQRKPMALPANGKVVYRIF